MSERRLPWPSLALAAVLLAAAAAFAVIAIRGPGSPATLQDGVRSVASTLRCPVCQNLSVADSPSPLARQMRATIGTELQTGRTPQQIRDQFAAAYGEWILLAPPKQGIDMAVWLAPLGLLIGGLALIAVSVRRWTAGSASAVHDEGAEPPLSPADRRLLERALATLPEEAE